MKKGLGNFWKLARVSGLYVREIVGWALMLLGLNFFLISLSLIRPEPAGGGYVPGLVIEGFIATIMGLVVFRGGLQLVKVSVAARAVRADPRFSKSASENAQLVPPN